MSARDGGPAFARPAGPYVESEGSCANESYRGMSLRDYFAAAILQGFASNQPYLRESEKALKDEGINQLQDALPAFIAQMAYTMADAMLAERDK